jgi:hypothetical protein
VKAKKPTYTWKVVFLTAASPLPEEKFRSERAAYVAVNRQRELIAEGFSRVIRAAVYEWDVDGGRWMTFERHDLKKEAGELVTSRQAAPLTEEPDDWKPGDDSEQVDVRSEK